MPYTEDDPNGIAIPVHRGAHIADPGPLGLAAFALTTFILSCANAGFIPVKAEAAVFGVAFFLIVRQSTAPESPRWGWPPTQSVSSPSPRCSRCMPGRASSGPDPGFSCC